MRGYGEIELFEEEKRNCYNKMATKQLTISEGPLIGITYESTLGDLKKQIAMEDRIPEQNVNVSYKNVILRDNSKKLSDYGMKNGDNEVSISYMAVPSSFIFIEQQPPDGSLWRPRRRTAHTIQETASRAQARPKG